MIIFLYGEDVFRSREKLNALKEKYLQTDKAGTGLSVFDCEEEKEIIKKIKDSAYTSNLFASKRLLIIKNIISALPSENQKQILEFLKNKKDFFLKDKDLVFIFWENNQPKKNGGLYKFLENNSTKQNFKKLSGKKLEAWIMKKINKINPKTKISNLALSKLITYTNGDTFILFNEIEKLANYAENRMIDEKDVDTLVKSNLDSNIFDTINAISKNDKKKALLLLHTHLEKGDDSFYLMSMFFYQFRNMLKISDLYENGIRFEAEISRATKLHPYIIKKSLPQIRNFSFKKLKEIYEKLSDLDTKIKTGRIEIQLALDKFIAEI